MSKKKTHEEYVMELAEVNPDIEVIGIYCGSKTKIPHRCKKDGYVWDISPSNALKGRGCPKCSGTYKKTHNEYVEELYKVNPNIDVIGTFCGNKTKISHRCKIDGYVWDIKPDNALRGKGCPRCARNAKRTHKEYVDKLAGINPNLEVLGIYCGAHIKIPHRCRIDGYTWDLSPNNALAGRNCPKCSGHVKRTHEEYVKQLFLVNKNLCVIGTYINNSTPILHKCLTHNIEWNAVPYRVLDGCGCPECGKESFAKMRRKTHEEYINELKIINKNIIPIEEYINAITPITHKCLIDGFEWKISPNTILSQNVGCPQCHESKGERSIRLWLEKNNIDYIHQYKYENCKDIYTLPFDFYLPTYNILIEYDGEQHFRPIEYFGGREKFELQQKHDNIKNEYCKDNGIPLLRIPYYKYEDIEEELNNFLFI